MVSGYSTLVQFQSGTLKIRVLHYNNKTGYSVELDIRDTLV